MSGTAQSAAGGSNNKTGCWIRLDRHPIFSEVLGHHVAGLDLTNGLRASKLHGLLVRWLFFANKFLSCKRQADPIWRSSLAVGYR